MLRDLVIMRKLLAIYTLIMTFVLSGCDFMGSADKARDAIDSIEIVRYDRVEARYLTTGDFAALQEMNTVFPKQTRALIEDLLNLGTVNNVNINKNMLEYFQDSTLQNIIYTAESEFADMTDLDKDLKAAFRNLKKEIPNAEIPTFYTQIGSLDQSIVVDDNAIGISLDKYLGKNYSAYLRFYDEKQRESMSREYIVPDCMLFYLVSKYGLHNNCDVSQHDRDANMGIIMYVTNKMVGRKAFKNALVDRVATYMKKHPSMTIRDILETADYSGI